MVFRFIIGKVPEQMEHYKLHLLYPGLIKVWQGPGLIKTKRI
jgi:hypothetical protein